MQIASDNSCLRSPRGLPLERRNEEVNSSDHMPPTLYPLDTILGRVPLRGMHF